MRSAESPSRWRSVRAGDFTQVAVASAFILAFGIAGGEVWLALAIAVAGVPVWLAGRWVRRVAEPVFHHRLLYVVGGMLMVLPLAAAFVLVERYPSRRGTLHPDLFVRCLAAIALFGGIGWWEWRRANGELRGARSERRLAVEHGLCHWCGMAQEEQTTECGFCGKDPRSPSERA